MRRVYSLPYPYPPKYPPSNHAPILTRDPFTGLFTDKSPFHPLSPSESLFSEQLDELKGRFNRADESELMLIAHDLMAENRQLDKFVKKASLETWFKGVLEGARREAVHGVLEGDVFEEGDTIMDE